MKNVFLGKYYDEFVAERVRSGRYATASEVIREALRHLENQERQEAEKLEILREAVRKGLDDPTVVDAANGFEEIDAIIQGCEAK